MATTVPVRKPTGAPRPGRPLAVFPGNVGDDDALADLVALLLGRTP